MDIIKTCPFTGIRYTWNLPVTEQQLFEWRQGGLIQQVMPELSPDQREFIMTGITPDVWDETFRETPK